MVKVERSLFFLLFFAWVGKGEASERWCTYSTWTWNTRSQASQAHRTVRKRYAELTANEKDPYSACTVCEEDQTPIEIAGLPAFKICTLYAAPIRRVMGQLQAAGFPVQTISAYRVGLSKGPADRQGLRTQFSNHSFGTAIDVNAQQNGLYTDCPTFSSDCRLLRGGPWNPPAPGTITRDSVVYKSFREVGWKWGGDLEGRQKDFMHFSLSGD